MQKKLLVSASFAALIAATAANAEVTGSLDVNASYGAETTGMNSTFFQGGATGQLEFGLMDQWNGQLEMFGSVTNTGTSTWYGKYGDNSGLSTAGGALHVNTVVDDVQFGPFLMLESTTVGDQGAFAYNGYGAGQNLYLSVGGEARWHWTSDFDLNAQVGGLFNVDEPGSMSVGCGALCNAFFVGGGATYFFDDDNSLSANVAWIGGQGGHYVTCCTTDHPAGSESGWDYGATFSHQFDGSPFAAYVSYDGNTFATTNTYESAHYVQHDNVVSVGVKWFFNGDTLRSQHNNAGFKAPHFERMIMQSLSSDDVSY